MDVIIAICTYGSPEWIDLALTRAIPSAESQARTVHVHGTSLQQARNHALSLVRSEFVIYLDADDELEPGYVAAMAAGTADLRAPAVRYVRGRPRAAALPQVAGHDHQCAADCLPAGNWLVIGTCVRTQLLRAAGGWGDEALYEDWSAWLRCYLAGGTVEAIPAAVYRAHVRRDSRNRAPSRAEKDRWHWQIHDACFAGAA